MAVGETARLVASLELQDKFSRTADAADRKLGGLDRKMGTTTRATKGLGVAGVAVGTALGNVAVNLASMVTRGAVGFIGAGIESLNQLESVVTETNTVIASTQGVAGQTADEIRNLAEKYEGLNATIDDKVIQDAANTLLTFTGVGEKAFEPALEAALNMNQLLGGGPEGMQGIVTMVGKALNDPIRGLTALSRKGVVFTDQQREQIKVLQESGDLLGAQQVILDELATEYGGQFAQAGTTAAARQAAFNDRIEDLQKALTGPLLPAIDRIRERLIDFMGSPRVLQGVEKLGAAIAGLFTDENLDRGVALVERGIDMLSGANFASIGSGLGGIVAKIGGLPWQAIGDAAKLLGTGSKALLDAFLGLPGWVQTAVLTGWGLNKLTGGALTGIIGQLASGLVKGVLGINAGVVNVNAATVNGGPGGVPGGGAGGLAGKLALGTGVVAAGVAAAMTVEFGVKTSAKNEELIDTLDSLPRRTAADINTSIDRVDRAIDAANSDITSTLVSEFTGIGHNLREERAELQRVKDNTARAAAAARDAIPWHQRIKDEVRAANESEGNRFANLYVKQDNMIGKLAGQTGILGAIRDKSWSVNVNAYIPVSVGINGTLLQRTIHQQSVLAGNSTSGRQRPV